MHFTPDLFQQRSIKMSAQGHLNFAQEKEFLMFPFGNFSLLCNSDERPEAWRCRGLWNQAGAPT